MLDAIGVFNASIYTEESVCEAVPVELWSQVVCAALSLKSRHCGFDSEDVAITSACVYCVEARIAGPVAPFGLCRLLVRCDSCVLTSGVYLHESI